MAENGGTHLSPDAAVNPRLGIWFPYNFSHKVVEERSSSSGRCSLRWTEEAALLESQKYRQFAADCVRLAQTMAATDKQTLLEIAAAWEKRAQEADVGRSVKADQVNPSRTLLHFRFPSFSLKAPRFALTGVLSATGQAAAAKPFPTARFQRALSRRWARGFAH